MRPSRIMFGIVAGSVAAVMLGAPRVAAQMSQGHQHGTTEPAKPQAGLAAKCQAMMADHDKMMAEMKAADARLDELVARMTAASGPAKVDAVAAVVSELVAQRKTMRDRMMTAQQEMMGHMMEHMQAGKESMAMCPMMKSMGGMKD